MKYYVLLILDVYCGIYDLWYVIAAFLGHAHFFFIQTHQL